MSPMGVSADDAFKEIKKPSTCNATQVNNFPVKILKQNADVFTANMSNIFSFCVNESKFPNILKQANVTTAFKRSRGVQGELSYCEYFTCHCKNI